MRLLSLVIVAVGLLLEAAAAYVLLAGVFAAAAIPLAIFLHALAAALTVLGVYIALPSTYREPRIGALAFLGSSTFLIPLLGPLGLSTAMLLGLYWAYEEKSSDWDTLAIPDLPFQPVEVDPNDVFMRDGLASVLLHFEDRNRRQRAIMACRHLSHRRAVPILRVGLADPADEVRLLAYAMLNSIERDLESQITTAQNRIEVSGDPDGELHEETAKLYWEYSYLQLARGSVEAVLLGKATQALDIAIRRKPSVQRWYLRARICLALDSYDAAEDALSKSVAMGLDEDDAAPYWAELAFSRGNFAAVAPALARMSPEAGANPVMRPVLEYWL